MEMLMAIARKCRHKITITMYGLLLLVVFFSHISYGAHFTRSIEVDLSKGTTTSVVESGIRGTRYDLSPYNGANPVFFSPVKIKSGDSLKVNIDFLGTQKFKVKAKNGFYKNAEFIDILVKSPLNFSVSTHTRNRSLVTLHNLEGNYRGVQPPGDVGWSCYSGGCLYGGAWELYRNLTDSSFSFSGISITFDNIKILEGPSPLTIDRLENITVLAGDVKYSGSGGNKTEQVTLLLHGMNSSPNTWDKFTKKYFNRNCSIIDAGSGDFDPKPNSFNTSCYTVKFGEYDKYGPEGLENAKQYGIDANLPWAGDFSTFDQLGAEVEKAVWGILKYHPRAEIVLIGHSRGGLAARTFLQKSQSSAAKGSVVGLITIGTPHEGTPLGRAYSYLKNNPRKLFDNDSDLDWGVVDMLRGAGGCTILLPSPVKESERIDIRRPVTDYLSDESNMIEKLGQDLENLPSQVRYGVIQYAGVELGQIAKNYTIFGTDSPCYQLSQKATDYIMGDKEPSDYDGDGIVPKESQNYSPPSDNVQRISKDNGTLHTEELNETENIKDIFCKLDFDKWISKCKN